MGLEQQVITKWWQNKNNYLYKQIPTDKQKLNFRACGEKVNPTSSVKYLGPFNPHTDMEH